MVLSKKSAKLLFYIVLYIYILNLCIQVTHLFEQTNFTGIILEMVEIFKNTSKTVLTACSLN